MLFSVNYFNLDPSYYEAASFAGIFLTKKFWALHILLAFPLIAAALVYRGWLKILFLLSMIFQVVAVLFTKSRGGGISFAVILILFSLYFLWDLKRESVVVKRNKGWLGALGVSILVAHAFPGVRETTLHMFGRLFDLFSPQKFEHHAPPLHLALGPADAAGPLLVRQRPGHLPDRLPPVPFGPVLDPGMERYP